MLKLILLHEQTNFTVYLLYAMTSATTCITADRTTDTPKPTNIFVLPQSSFSNGLPYSCKDHLDHFLCYAYILTSLMEKWKSYVYMYP